MGYMPDANKDLLESPLWRGSMSSQVHEATTTTTTTTEAPKSAHEKYYNRYYYNHDYRLQTENPGLFIPRVYEPILTSNNNYNGYDQNIEYIFAAAILFLLIIICWAVWCIICAVSTAVISFKIGKNSNENRYKNPPDEYNQV